MATPPEYTNWVFDYALIGDLGLLGSDVGSLESRLNWSSSVQGFGSPTHLRVNVDHSLLVPDEIKKNDSRKRSISACNPSVSKASKEKMRRDKLNDRFMELGCLLEPGRPPKVDKAIHLVTQLPDQTNPLKESNGNLQQKITELKAEKSEL